MSEQVRMSGKYVVPDPTVPRLKMTIKGDTTLEDYAKFLTNVNALLDAVAKSMGLEKAVMWMVETPSIDYEEAS